MASEVQEIVFRTVVDTGNSSQNVDKLNDSIKETDESVKKTGKDFNKMLSDVDEKVNSGELSFRQLSKVVKEYQSIALQAGRESVIGQEALQKAAALSDELADLTAEVNALAHDGANMQAALQLGSTVTAGYGALQGAMALVGGESEELQETMVKLQAVQAVLNGIEQVRANLEKESFLMIKAKAIATKGLTVVETIYAAAVGTTTGAMKALRIAMLALPIVAIIAGIVALVGWLVSLADVSEDVEGMNDKLTESYDRQSKAMQANAQAYERDINNKIRLAKLQNATEEEVLGLEQKRLAIKEVGRKQEMKALAKQVSDQSDLYKKAYDQQDFELATKIRGEIQANRQKYFELKRLDGQYFEDNRALRLEYENKQKQEQEEADKKAQEKAKEYAKKREEARKAEAQKRLEETRMYEDLIATNIADEDLRKLTQLKLQQQRELEEVRKKYGERSKVVSELETKQQSDREALTEEFRLREEEARKGHDEFVDKQRQGQAEKELASQKAILEAKLIATKEDFDVQQKLKRDLAQLELTEALAQEGITMGEKLKLQEEYNAKIDALDEELAQKQIERRKRVEEAGTAVAVQGLEAVQGLANAFFDAKMSRLEKGSAEELRVAKKAFEINKKLQIAQAIVQGVQATLAAYSSGSAIPIVGAVTGPLFAALAAATAVANIVKIKNSTFESPGSGSSTPSVAPPQIPDFSATTQTAGLTGSGTENTGNNIPAVAPGKVVLVDSDLKAGIKETQKVDVLSSLG